MSEIKKLRKKIPESSNSCPIPRRTDPQSTAGKKINKQRTQGVNVLRSPESRLKEWECLGIVTCYRTHSFM